jgi:hypothetical protein
LPFDDHYNWHQRFLTADKAPGEYSFLFKERDKKDRQKGHCLAYSRIKPEDYFILRFIEQKI